MFERELNYNSMIDVNFKGWYLYYHDLKLFVYEKMVIKFHLKLKYTILAHVYQRNIQLHQIKILLTIPCNPNI